MAAHDDDLLGTKPLRGDHAAESDGTVADHGDALPGADLGDDGRVVAGAHDVGEGEQGGHQRVVLADGQRVEGPVRLRDAHGFGLRAGHVGVPEEAAMDALRLQALLAEDAGAVREGERHHNHVADLDGAYVSADLLHHTDRLVPHHARTVARLQRLVGPKVGAADAGARHADHRIGRLLDRRIGNVLDANIACCVHHCSAHY